MTVFCKDCKYRKRHFGGFIDWCKHPDNKEFSHTSLITGKKYYTGESVSCGDNRSSYLGKCGPEGKLFEKKKFLGLF